MRRSRHRSIRREAAEDMFTKIGKVQSPLALSMALEMPFHYSVA